MLRTWIERLARVVPGTLYRAAVRRPATGFFYHVVSDVRLPHIFNLYAYKTARQFEDDLLYIKERYIPITYDELLAHHVKGQQLRRNSVMISFDDGCAECYTVVRLLLNKYAIPCVFFLTTSLLDNRQMLFRHVLSLCIEQVRIFSADQQESAFAVLNQLFGQDIHDLTQYIRWTKSIKTENQEMQNKICEALNFDVSKYLQDRQPYLTSKQVEELGADGFTIGAHSRSHAKFISLTPDQIEDEIVSSCIDIQQRISQNNVPFAFPFSSHGISRRVLSQIAQRNPAVGLLFDSKGFRKDDPLIYNRIWADTPGETGEKSNLPGLIRSAYEEYFTWRMQRIFR